MRLSAARVRYVMLFRLFFLTSRFGVHRDRLDGIDKRRPREDIVSAGLSKYETARSSQLCSDF